MNLRYKRQFLESFNFRNNLLHGEFLSYDEDGQLKNKGNFKYVPWCYNRRSKR